MTLKSGNCLNYFPNGCPYSYGGFNTPMLCIGVVDYEIQQTLFKTFMYFRIAGGIQHTGDVRSFDLL